MVIAICSDNGKEQGMISHVVCDFLSHLNLNPEIISFTEKEEIAKLANNQFYIAIVSYDGIDGYKVSQSLRMAAPDCKIIWVSDEKKLGFMGYDINLTYFLEKPINEDKMNLALQKCFGKIIV